MAFIFHFAFKVCATGMILGAKGLQSSQVCGFGLLNHCGCAAMSMIAGGSFGVLHLM